MNNFKKLFLLFLLSSFSANFNAFGMNSDDDWSCSFTKEDNTKPNPHILNNDTLLNNDYENQISSNLSSIHINKAILEEPTSPPSNNIFDYEDVLAIIFSKLNDKNNFLNVKCTCKRFNEITNFDRIVHKWATYNFLKQQTLTRIPSKEELTNIEAFNNYLEEQKKSLVQKNLTLLQSLFPDCETQDIENSEFVRNIVVTLTNPDLDKSKLLHLAARNGNLQIVQFLITNGAYVNAKDQLRQIPLYEAVCHDDLPIVQLLLDNGADINAKEHLLGQTPLHEAVCHDDLPIVQELLNHNADFDTKDLVGQIPLHKAVNHGNLPIVQELLNRKSKVNAATNEGITPLYIAARIGHTKVVLELLRHDAIVRQKDLKPKNLNTEIREMLQKKFDKQQSQNKDDLCLIL